MLSLEDKLPLSESEAELDPETELLNEVEAEIEADSETLAELEALLLSL
ncbi:hypothetical protein NtB2_00900 [Lactococcus termiticola]|uniref:Uncharacterized protein n=1 Tax=Lactococcus termiticola TaxID=2169526 RepID=A0A2R5HG02_9LACT|nr:hypothetical protein NtB2_00900 [Lactococcus termiticola]